MKQYKILMGTFADYLQDKVNEAAKQGYQYQDMATGPNSTVVVMSIDVTRLPGGTLVPEYEREAALS